jgi:hypothetical protein
MLFGVSVILYFRKILSGSRNHSNYSLTGLKTNFLLHAICEYFDETVPLLFRH